MRHDGFAREVAHCCVFCWWCVCNVFINLPHFVCLCGGVMSVLDVGLGFVDCGTY